MSPYVKRYRYGDVARMERQEHVNRMLDRLCRFVLWAVAGGLVFFGSYFVATGKF